MNEKPNTLEREIAARFRDGPSLAPSGLLNATLSATRGSRQRAGVFATLLGAPAGGGRVDSVAGLTRWQVLIVALLAVVVAAAVFAAGATRPQNPLLIMAPTAAPSKLANARATLEPNASISLAPSPGPTPSSTPLVPASASPDVYSLPDWGITLHRDSSTPWQAVETGFNRLWIGMDMVGDPIPYVLVPSPDITSRDLLFGSCSESGCRPPIITLSVARNGSGPLVASTSCYEAPASFVLDCIASNDRWPVIASGTTLAELQQSWVDQIGAAEITTRTIGGERAVVLSRGGLKTLLAIHGDVRLALVMQQALGDAEASDVARMFDAVIDGFSFVPAPQRTGTLDDLELTMPEGWTVMSEGNTMLVRPSTGSLFATEQRITALRPGESLRILRPVMSGGTVNTTAGFSITGRTLEQLAASIDAAMSDATRRDTEIGGEAGFVWSVPQTSYVGPLAAVAAVEWKGSFYVFQIHVPFDGPADAMFAPLLNGVTFR